MPASVGMIVEYHHRHCDAGPNGEPAMEIIKHAQVTWVHPLAQGETEAKVNLAVPLDSFDMALAPYTASMALYGGGGHCNGVAFDGATFALGTWRYAPSQP